MNHLIGLLKETELELRSSGSINSKYIWDKYAELRDWEYRIVQDFMLRVNNAITNKDMNFVYKLYEKESNNAVSINKQRFDLVIATTRREKEDVVLTDVYNRLVIPDELTFTHVDVWGYDIVTARNLAVKIANDHKAKYLLFVDDDIVAPNNALITLYNNMLELNKPVVGGLYYKKISPLCCAHSGVKSTDIPTIKNVEHCAMGFTLIDIDYISKYVPFPLFWAFGSEDGYWSMGEDYFFSKNVAEYTNVEPIINTDVKLLHYDKKWKKCYGRRDYDKTYATNGIFTFDQFNNLRIPNKYPLISICVPQRDKSIKPVFNLSKLVLLRGYQSEVITCDGMKVDAARNYLVEEALKKDSEYILFIDDDIVPEGDSLCKALDFIETDSKIGAVSGDYNMKGLPIHSAHLLLDDEGLVKEKNRMPTSRHTRCNWLSGLGFCLIRARCFHEIRKPWFMCHTFQDDSGVNEDAHFTELMMQSGNEVWIDNDIKCGHYDFKDNKLYTIDKKIDNLCMESLYEQKHPSIIFE